MGVGVLKFSSVKPDSNSAPSPRAVNPTASDACPTAVIALGNMRGRGMFTLVIGVAKEYRRHWTGRLAVRLPLKQLIETI